MPDNQIQITISGSINSGTSSLAELIRDALTPYGVKVGITDIDNRGKQKPTRPKLSRRLLSLADRETEVSIVIKQNLLPGLHS